MFTDTYGDGYRRYRPSATVGYELIPNYAGSWPPVYKKFYFRPKIAISYLKRPRSIKVLLGYLFAAISLLSHIFEKKIWRSKESMNEGSYN